jgi:hypothetical protein
MSEWIEEDDALVGSPYLLEFPSTTRFFWGKKLFIAGEFFARSGYSPPDKFFRLLFFQNNYKIKNHPSSPSILDNFHPFLTIENLSFCFWSVYQKFLVWHFEKSVIFQFGKKRLKFF